MKQDCPQNPTNFNGVGGRQAFPFRNEELSQGGTGEDDRMWLAPLVQEVQERRNERQI
jgi:hypothetical protein